MILAAVSVGFPNAAGGENLYIHKQFAKTSGNKLKCNYQGHPTGNFEKKT